MSNNESKLKNDNGSNGKGEHTFKKFGTLFCAFPDCEKPIAYFPSNSDYYDDETEIYCYHCAKALDRSVN